MLRHKHTWVMSFLYIGTFGSFIGYSAAMPLLIKLNFYVPTPAPAGTGINFAYYAFLGALVGSITRPFGGWLADKYGGARVTLCTFGAMIAGTLGVLWSLAQLTPNPTQDPAIALANESMFPWFLAAFLFVFAATGIGNGSTFRMIPVLWQNAAKKATPAGRRGACHALARSTKEASAVIGIASAVGAIGGFLIPLSFGAPWIDDPVEAVQTSFAVFTVFYAVCLATTWWSTSARRASPRSPAWPTRGSEGAWSRQARPPEARARPSSAQARGRGTEPGRRRDPLPVLLAAVRHAPHRPPDAGGRGLAGVPGQRGRPVPQGLDRHRPGRAPRAAHDPAAARPGDGGVPAGVVGRGARRRRRATRGPA